MFVAHFSNVLLLMSILIDSIHTLSRRHKNKEIKREMESQDRHTYIHTDRQTLPILCASSNTTTDCCGRPFETNSAILGSKR